MWGIICIIGFCIHCVIGNDECSLMAKHLFVQDMWIRIPPSSIYLFNLFTNSFLISVLSVCVFYFKVFYVIFLYLLLTVILRNILLRSFESIFSNISKDQINDTSQWIYICHFSLFCFLCLSSKNSLRNGYLLSI